MLRFMCRLDCFAKFQVQSERKSDAEEMRRLRESEKKLLKEIQRIKVCTACHCLHPKEAMAMRWRVEKFIHCLGLNLHFFWGQAEEDANAEAKEIYRSKLERALEEELHSCRKQLEQKHRDCHAEVEASTRARAEHAQQMRRARDELQEVQVANEVLQAKIESLTYVSCCCSSRVVWLVHAALM